MSLFPKTNLGWKLRILMGSFALDSTGVKIGKLISAFIIIAFSVLSTFFFKYVFEKTMKLEGIGEPLLWKVLSITFTTLFALLLISSLITGISTLYKSRELTFFFVKPLQYRVVFLNRFMENVFYSSWSIAVLGIPILIAWGIIYKTAWWLILIMIFFGLFPLVIVSSLIGTFVLMLLILLAKYSSPKISMLIVLMVFSIGIYWISQQRSKGFVIEGVSRMTTVDRYLSDMTRDLEKPLSPANWFVSSLYAFKMKQFTKMFYLLLLLNLTSIVWLVWLALFAERVYFSSWLAFNEMRGSPDKITKSRLIKYFYFKFIPNPVRAILVKDIAVFVRSPNQWGQFIILVSFLLIYLVNLIYVSSRFDFDHPFWKTLVLFLNFAFTGFILATLSVRFVFPLISLEGRGINVIKKAPVAISVLFWEKFFLSFIIFMMLCQLIVFFSNKVLNITGLLMLLTTLGTFLMGISLTSLSIGMGAIMPDFREENPMRIASTPGGMLTVIISLIFIAAMVAIIALPTREYFLAQINNGEMSDTTMLSTILIMMGLNALVLAVPLHYGRSALSKRDS